MLPGPRRVVGFSSCARDCWRREFGARDFPACAGAGPRNLPAASGTGAVPPRHGTALLGEVWQAGNVPPSTAAVLAASPGPVGESGAQWPSPPFAEERTGPSAKPEEMILRPQSRGDLGVPVHKGTTPAGAAVGSGGAAFHTVLCLTRLQSRSDARLGSGVRMQQPC